MNPCAVSGWGGKNRTPLDIVRTYNSAITRQPAAEGLVDWLLSRGAKSADEITV
jgi:hypothetical protein